MRVGVIFAEIVDIASAVRCFLIMYTLIPYLPYFLAS